MLYRSKINKISKTRKMVFLSILLAMALVLGFFEQYIPIQWVPGAKIGLANIVTLTCLYFFSFGETLILVLLRITLGSGIFGSGFLFSLAGGLLSFIMMYLLIHIGRDHFSTMAISMVGAISHITGQLFMASLIFENFNIFLLFPPLFGISIVTGFAIGVVVKYLIQYLTKILD